MTQTVLEPATAEAESSDLDLDIQISEVGSVTDGVAFGAVQKSAAPTSPNTWGVQSRCWTCCP
ncbi:hypothetical protein [Streptomyces mayteni]